MALDPGRSAAPEIFRIAYHPAIAFELLMLDCDGVLVDSETISHGIIVDMGPQASLALT